MAAETVEELRRLVLESWTLTAQRVAVVTAEDVKREEARGKRRDLPRPPWEPFAVLLQRFEDAVRGETIAELWAAVEKHSAGGQR